MTTNYDWRDEVFQEKVASWGWDYDTETDETRWDVYFTNDRWDDYETFKTEDEADNFAEEMRAEGYEVRIRERAA